MRNIGSSHHGLADWYWQRVSALVLLVLLPGVLLVLLNLYSGAWHQQELLEYMNQGWVRILHTMLLLALLQHAFLGVKVIVEDYLHIAGLRVFVMVFLLLLVVLGGLTWMSWIWSWG